MIENKSDSVKFLKRAVIVYATQVGGDIANNAAEELAALQAENTRLTSAYAALWSKYGDLCEPTIDEIKQGITKRVDER